MPPTEPPHIPPPPASSSRLTPLAAVLDAWAALCAAAGRRSLSASRALEAGTPGQREALAAALVALGYPEAMASPQALGSTLRALRGRHAADGRRLERSAADGRSIWYVVPALEVAA